MNIQTTTLWCLKHLESLKEFFIALPHKWRFASLHRKLLAHRYNLLIRPDASFIETSCGMGELVNGLHASQKVGVDLSPGQITRGRERYPHLDLRPESGETTGLLDDPFYFVILSSILNCAAGMEVLLRRMHASSHRGTRLLINVYNMLCRPLLALVRRLGLSAEQVASNWLPRQAVINLFWLADREVFKSFFSWLLGQPVKDTLCGTKVLWRKDYERIDRGRAYFGNFDPFGDFDLLFGADKQNLKIVDVPIRYRERFYGETNIQRWKHGVILVRMVLFAGQRLKFV
jgi:hypothetical protein